MANNTEDLELRKLIGERVGMFTGVILRDNPNYEMPTNDALDLCDDILTLIQQEANRQKAELLDEIYSERDTHLADTGCSDEVGYIPQSVIEAERNKLRGETK